MRLLLTSVLLVCYLYLTCFGVVYVLCLFWFVGVGLLGCCFVRTQKRYLSSICGVGHITSRCSSVLYYTVVRCVK